MDYVQLTLDDWLEMKQSLERELSNLKTGFIRVGYVLRRIEESRGYEQDGYKSVAEFAKEEYGLSPSTVSRFMAINERFSLGGYSERLDPQYVGFRQSIMGELLGLPDQDIKLVTPETSRADVRELKQFNRQEPEKGVADDLRGLLESYFRDNREELNELYDGSGQATQDILNPSGNRVFRKGMYMLSFYPETAKMKQFGEETTVYTWEEFRELIDGVFASSAGPDTYSRYFGVPSEGPESEAPEPEKEPQQDKSDQTAPESDQTAAENEQSAAENADRVTAAAEEQEAARQDEIMPEPEQETPPAEAGAPIAPAQKQQPPKAERDLATMMGGLQKAVKARNWDAALSFAEGIEAALRKIRNS